MTQTDAPADELPQPGPLALEVVATSVLSPRMTRLRLSGPDLAGFRFVAGQDLMLAMPNGGDGTINRRYTIRAGDPDERTVDLDAVIHGDGPGARWFAAAAPGDRIDAVGPRGKIVVSPTAEWHLFVGDESGLPAIAVMIEALPPGSTAVAVVEVADPAEEQPIVAPASISISWVHRGATAPGDSAALTRAVRAIAFPPGVGHAYLAAELGVVAELRTLLAERGFAPEHVSPKAYWRRGAANAGHGEPLRDRP